MHLLRRSLRLNAQSFSSSSRKYSTSLSRNCPACSTPLPTALPTCPKCRYIEPLPSGVSHFDLLGYNPSFDPFKLDLKDLRQRFLRAQRVCHPDAWSSKGQKEQQLAAAQSSQLNTAYRTLASPLLRAQYILLQLGHDTLSESDKLSDPALVMEIMEIREQLDEAASADEVESIRSKNEAEMRALYTLFGQRVAEQNWEEAKRCVVKLKYLESIDTAARDWRSAK